MKLLTDQAEIGQAIEALREQFENGTLEAIALRIYKADGTWADRVLGGTDSDQTAAPQACTPLWLASHSFHAINFNMEAASMLTDYCAGRLAIARSLRHSRTSTNVFHR